MTGDETTVRETARLPEEMSAELDERIERGQFFNKSEAIRDAVRRMLDETRPPAARDRLRGDD